MFKKIYNSVRSFVKNTVSKASRKVSVSVGFIAAIYTAIVTVLTGKAHKLLKNTKAEAYVDTGVKILIAVVVGALLLAGLYALFGDTIMPTVTEKVEELFDYAG